jgi:ADP-ribose pyrophosphatase YjhB (NUDIX family)
MAARESWTQRTVEAVEARLRAQVSPRMLRAAYRAGYLVLRPWWWLTRPRTCGLKAVVRCGDAVLLVRHTYARRDQWDIPGGFVRTDEDLEAALRRELGEELGVVPLAVRQIGAQAARVDRKRERLFIFAVDVAPGSPVTPSQAEIADVRWVRHDALPAKTTVFARRMVARAWWEEFR